MVNPSRGVTFVVHFIVSHNSQQPLLCISLAFLLLYLLSRNSLILQIVIFNLFSCIEALVGSARSFVLFNVINILDSQRMWNETVH